MASPRRPGLLVLAPLVLPTYAMTLLTEALILGLFAMSLDLMVGYTRLISFGHAAAYGLGAYACVWLLLHTSVPMLFAIPLAALLAGVIAIGVAWVCTQARGVSFSMLTLAFAQLLYAVAYKWTSVTGGSDGLAGIPRRPGPFALHLFVSRDGFYYLTVLVLLAAFLFCCALVRSPFGEPSQGLAPLVVRELARVIRLLCQDGVTILLIEQNLKLAAEVADCLAVMVKGRIVYSASPTTFSAEEKNRSAAAI
jgi:ABC-type branched-subunit amino acid transport system permease subunit